MTAPYDSYNYLGYWSNREYEDQAEKMALKKLLSEIPKDKKNSMIDIGAGFGRHASVYAPQFKKGVLLDPSKNLLEEAQSKLKNYSHLEFKHGKADELPFKKNQFDTAIVIRVVHHLPEPKEAFLEASRVLKPHGYLVVEFANKTHFRARLRAWLKGDFGFTKNLNPEEQRSPASIKAKKIVFINHHPKKVENDLKEAGFKIIDRLSVSNFRHPFIKKVIPLRILLFFEFHYSLLTTHYSSLNYFGPSIFLLCQKVD